MSYRTRLTPAERKAQRETAAREQARRDAIRAGAVAVVSSGKCPKCGGGLRRNLALTGWYQCEQYGTEGFRKDDTRPACSFQCFTA
jgi:hypothetical protein